MINPNPNDQQGPELTPQQEQEYRKNLQQLPKGRDFNNWLAQQLADRLGKTVLWRYVDTNAQTQQQSNRIEILDGETEDTMGVIEPNRDEAARTFATGIDWIDNIIAMLDSGGDGEVSGMHEKLENDLSEKYEDMMNKITGSNDE